MAQITCSKSGVIFRCEHLPASLSSSLNYVHPFFHIPQKKLISLAGQWAAQKLTPTESYLLYLSLLDSTDLIVWRTQASYTPQTSAKVASNMPALLSIISKINLIKHPSFTLPSFAISPDTHTLQNSNHWIEVWTRNYHEWYDDYLASRRRDELQDRLDRREISLQRLIKSSVPTESYATTLAEWAATAGEFPESQTIHPISKQPISISEYWKQLIRTVANEDRLWRYPRKDLVELIEHCEDYIQHGNIYAHTLMMYLRGGLKRYDNYLGFGTSSTEFTYTTETNAVHQLNRAALIATAPVDEPKKHQYPTTIAWLKAYSKWKVASSGATQI